MKKKKIISGILAFFMLLTLTPKMVAAGKQSATTALVNTTYNEEGLLGMFGPMTVQAEKDLPQEVMAEYSYEQYEDELGSVVVDMELTLRYGADSITLHPTGIIVHSQRTESLGVWSGPLEAEFEVQGETYFAMIGFNKFDGVEGVHFTAVITPPEGSGGEDIILDFGDDIATSKVVEETRNSIDAAMENRAKNKNNAFFRSTRALTSGFSVLDSDVRGYRSGDNMQNLKSTDAQECTVYFKPSGKGTASNLRANILAVGVNSFIADYERSYAKNSMYGFGYVSQLSISASYDFNDGDAKLVRFRSLKSLENDGSFHSIIKSALVLACEKGLDSLGIETGGMVSFFVDILSEVFESSRAKLAHNGSEAEMRVYFIDSDQDAFMDDVPFLVDWDVDADNTYDYPFSFTSDLTSGFIDSSSYSYFTKARTANISVDIPYVYP